jgi:epoxyqueuosine reductase QueG
MLTLEENIKDVAKKAGADLVGLAGPGRFNGPPSIDPAYIMKGAKSIVSVVVGFNVPAIYDFLGKVSPYPHNIDEAVCYQKGYRAATSVADYLKSKGYKARVVEPNAVYRRALDPFATRPTFSHRFGAVVSGLGTFGLSGNVVTKEFGASIMLDTVVTNAVLESDPVRPANETMEKRCYNCKLCEKTCTMGMFSADEEEYLLINGELHSRGKHYNLDFCNAPCFGLHGISRDKKWTNWGQFWIKEWMDGSPDPEQREKVRSTFMKVGARAGDSHQRFMAIIKMARNLYPKSLTEDFFPSYENLPKDVESQKKLAQQYYKNLGVELRDPCLVTCAQCVQVCGPDFEETKKRYDLLVNSGYIVPDANWDHIHVKTFEEAAALKAKYPRRVNSADMIKDQQGQGTYWMKNFFGFEPIEEFKNWVYQRKAKAACAKAGLAGKEAKAPIIINPGYLMGLAGGSKKKKKKREAPINVAGA